MDNQNNNAQQQPPAPYWLVLGALVTLITISTIFFHYVEGWTYFESYYYTIVTIATVGYGDFVPKTTIGRFGATILIILGIGLFSTFVSLLLKRRVEKDYKHKLSRTIKKTIKDGEKTIEKL